MILHEVVQILIEDESTVKEWRRLYNELAVNDSRRVQWEDGYKNSTLYPYELFTNFLSSWQSKNGVNASLDSLIQALKAIEKRPVADRLKKKFCIVEEPEILVSFREQLSTDTGMPIRQFEVNKLLNRWETESNIDSIIEKYPDAGMDIISALDKLRLFSEMLNFATCNYNKYINVLGKDHFSTMGMKHRLAFALEKTGRLTESLALYTQLLQQKRMIFGEEDKSTWVTAYNMALVLSKLNRFNEEKEILQEVFNAQRKILGDDHEDTMKTKNQIAVALGRRGAYSLKGNLEAFRKFINFILCQPSNK